MPSAARPTDFTQRYVYSIAAVYSVSRIAIHIAHLLRFSFAAFLFHLVDLSVIFHISFRVTDGTNAFGSTSPIVPQTMSEQRLPWPAMDKTMNLLTVQDPAPIRRWRTASSPIIPSQINSQPFVGRIGGNQLHAVSQSDPGKRDMKKRYC